MPYPSYRPKWTDEEILTFSIKDNEILWSVLVNLWGQIYQGKEKEPDFEKLKTWFNQIKIEARKQLKGKNGIFFNGTFYPIENEELIQNIIVKFIQPFE